MKILILLIMSLFVLTGCSSLGNILDTSGKAHYTYSKCVTTDGTETCTEIDLFNNKDIKALNGLVEIKPDGTILIQLDEKDSNASNLAQINASNQADLINVVKSLVPLPLSGQ